mmetsp:Transcript_29934/g.84430  ORF Transcript_29934/g.84430 Transcript_29934/m.84430 type:complete len:93 (-) Transcript_29934:1711-1989(-)
MATSDPAAVALALCVRGQKAAMVGGSSLTPLPAHWAVSHTDCELLRMLLTKLLVVENTQLGRESCQRQLVVCEYQAYTYDGCLSPLPLHREV